MDVHDLARALHQHGFVGKWAPGEHSWSGIGAAYLLAEAMWHPTWQPLIESHTRAAVEQERAAIVDWLREFEAKHRAAQDDGKHRTASKHHADACRGIANAIAARKAQP